MKDEGLKAYCEICGEQAGLLTTRLICDQCFTEENREITNTRWLIERTDRICEALAPGFIGTWQQRTEKAVEMAELMAKDVNDMRCRLTEARAAMYRIGVEVDLVMSRDMPGAKPIKDHK